MNRERSKPDMEGILYPSITHRSPVDLICQHPLTSKGFGAGCRGLAGKKQDLVFIIINGLQIEGANFLTQKVRSTLTSALGYI